MARLNKRLYRGLELDAGKDQELLKEYSPELRDEAYKRGLEEVKREIEFIVGLAYGDLSDVQEVSKTATEIKVSKQRKYNRVNAIEEKLEECLRDFVAGLAFYNKMYRSGYELSCKFSDSILTDEESGTSAGSAGCIYGRYEPRRVQSQVVRRDIGRGRREPASTKSGDGVGCEKNTRTSGR